MATGITVGGVDLDDIFAPRDGHSPVANTGYKVGAQDLADRYRASEGSHDRISYNTGISVAGADLRVIFRDKSYVATPPPVITSVTNSGPVYIGQSITLTCVATGADSYIWRKSGTIVSGGALLTFTTNSGSGGTYSCEAVNDGGSDFGSTTVTVLALPATTIGLTGPDTVTAGVFAGEQWDYSASNAAGLVNVRFQISGHSSGGWTPVTGNSYAGSTAWADPLGSPSISNTPGTYHFSFEAERLDGGVALATMAVTVL